MCTDRIESLRHAIQVDVEPGWIRAGLDDRDDSAAVWIRKTWGQRLARRCLVAPSLPSNLGGMGLGPREEYRYWAVMVECGAPTPMNGNALSILAPALLKYGTAEQIERVIPSMVRHDELWCQSFSETEAGSDLANVATSAVIEGDELVISGEKIWSSFGQYCDWAYALIRTLPGSRRHEGLSLVMVPLRQVGVRAQGIRTLNGKEIFASIYFDNARTAVANVVGELHDGWHVAMFALARERALRIGLRSLGLRADLDRALALCTELNGPARVRLEESAARAWSVVEAIEALFDGAVEAIESGGEGVEGAGASLGSMAKVLWLEARERLVEAMVAAAWSVKDRDLDLADQLLGSLLISRADSIRGGTSEIHLNGIARSLGLPSSKS